VTLLHLPTTSCILAFVTLGAVIAPIFNASIFLLTLLYFFLGSGIASNYYDELLDRPWKTTVPSKYLWIIGTISLTLSIVIGIYLTLITGIVFIIITSVVSFLIPTLI